MTLSLMLCLRADLHPTQPVWLLPITPWFGCVQRVKLRSQPAQWVARAAQMAAQRAADVREIQAARLRVAGAVRAAHS